MREMDRIFFRIQGHSISAGPFPVAQQAGIPMHVLRRF